MALVDAFLDFNIQILIHQDKFAMQKFKLGEPLDAPMVRNIEDFGYVILSFLKTGYMIVPNHENHDLIYLIPMNDRNKFGIDYLLEHNTLKGIKNAKKDE